MITYYYYALAARARGPPGGSSGASKGLVTGAITSQPAIRTVP